MSYLQSLGDSVDVCEAADLGEASPVILQFVGLFYFVQVLSLEMLQLELVVSSIMSLVDSCEIINSDTVLL